MGTYFWTWTTFVFMCVSQYMSLYISSTLMSTIKFAREKNTHKKFGWELEAFTGHLLHHLESNFVLHAAVPMNFLGGFLQGCLLQTQLNFCTPFEFPYLANQFCLGNFIMFTEIFQFVDCCVSVRLMGVSVRAWFDAFKRDSHAESARLDRYEHSFL